MLQSLATLPRETRDTLFLLVVIAWVMLPHVEHLPLWCSALALALLLWRGLIAVRSRPLPARWWLVLLLLICTAATYVSQRTLLGRDAGVSLVVLLLALKTMELRAQRDAFVVFFLGFFTLLSNFFYSQSLTTAAAMLLGLLGLLTALVNSHMPVGRPPLLLAARSAGFMALLGAPVMLVLFLLFPRLAPLWGVPTDAMSGRSGLSDSMEVGHIASLSLDSSVAMRIHFDATAPDAEALYFRGPVLSHFDGRTWRPAPAQRLTQPATVLQVSGPSVRYQITLEPNNHPWLLVLDATPQAPQINGYNASMAADLQWVTDRPLADLVRYRAESYTRFRYGLTQDSGALQTELELPAGLNPRTRAWAETLRSQAGGQRADGATLVAAVLAQLRNGGYHYTLEPGAFGLHSADEFWFDRKAGFCEHIAASFVLLMRAMQIPARVVTGYQGGERNAVDGDWTVRQSDAHAWAEVWLAGHGWQRVDPTAAVAPQRTASLQRLLAAPNAMAQILGAVSPQFRLNLRAAWEALNNHWNQWVLNYSQGKQMDLLRGLGFATPRWEDLLYVLIGVVVLTSLAAAAWTLWERRQHDPWLRLLQQARLRLRRAGLVLAEHTPPRQMAYALLQRAGGSDATAQECSQWLLDMEQWRYAPARSPHPLATLQRAFGKLPWPTHFD
ncbi:MAG: transglutaminaseTgpA domain-containing protein [Rhodoferax sp.]